MTFISIIAYRMIHETKNGMIILCRSMEIPLLDGAARLTVYRNTLEMLEHAKSQDKVYFLCAGLASQVLRHIRMIPDNWMPATDDILESSGIYRDLLDHKPYGKSLSEIWFRPSDYKSREDILTKLIDKWK